MAEILMTPQLLPASTTVATSVDAAAPGTQPSFAALLKSCGNWLPADCDGKTPSSADALPAVAVAEASSATAPAVDPLMLLAQFVPGADASVATATSGTSSLPSGLDAEARDAAARADGDGFPGNLVARELAADMDLPILSTPPALPYLPTANTGIDAPPPGLAGTGAALPAPTLATADAREGRDNRNAPRSRLPAGSAPAREPPAHELAGEAAITAESARPASAAVTPRDPGSDFRGALERFVQQPPVLAQQTMATTAASTPSPGPRLETPFGQTGWSQEVGEKLTWMVGSNRQQADLVLNPPQLGRIEVRISVEGDTLNATFAAANVAVREALENSMSRLRDVLADAGISLGETHVGAESREDPRSSDMRNSQRARSEAARTASVMPLDAAARGSAWVQTGGRGMVDVFA